MILPLGKILTELGYVKKGQIKEALERQREINARLWPIHLKHLVPVSANAGRAIPRDNRLGKILTEMNLVTADQVKEALQLQKTTIGSNIGSLTGEEAANFIQISSLINSALNDHELLKEVLACCNVLFDSTTSALFIRDQDKKIKKVVVSWDAGDEGSTIHVSPVDKIAESAIASGEAIWIDDPTSDPTFSGEANKFYGSIMCVPVSIKGRAIGAIQVLKNKIKPGFSPKDRTLLPAIANQIGIALDNIGLLGELNENLGDLEKTRNRIVQIEKTKALGEIAGGIAHDFNNLLAGVLGRVQLLQRKIDKNADPAVQKNLNIIEEVVLDGAAMVRRFLDFARSCRNAEGFTLINVTDIVKDAVRLIKARWENETQGLGKKIKLQTILEEVPPVAGEEESIREAVMNIVSNAIEALPESAGEIRISTQSQGPGVLIKISDTGTGISEELKGKILKPFFTTKDPAHCGLGLNISHNIIKRHGGNIEIENTENNGTTLIITLPAFHTEEHKPTPANKKLQKQKARILIIEDDEIVRNLLSEVLVDAGYELTVTNHGKEGIQLCKDRPFDLVITDLAMPEVSGWNVAQSIKKEKPATLVALVTGWEVETNDQRIKDYGIDLLIKKPFQVNEVINQIDEILQESRKNKTEKMLVPRSKT